MFYLARLNGRGFGRSEMMKWMPFGTLIANVGVTCIMAAFATTKKAVKDKHFVIVATGIQFGLCRCLSTVSIFIVRHHRQHYNVCKSHAESINRSLRQATDDRTCSRFDGRTDR